MAHRERVLKTFRFECPDRAAYDLMESCITWSALLDYFHAVHGLDDMNQVVSFLDTDFRWISTKYYGPEPDQEGLEGERTVYTQSTSAGPLSGAKTIADVEAHEWPNPSWWQPDDFAYTPFFVIALSG